MEIVVDEGRNVVLRFRDRSVEEIPMQVRINGVRGGMGGGGAEYTCL